MRVGLVGCVSEKRSSPAPSGQLYTSTLFRGRRAWVQRTCDRWFVISALHGLVRPEAILDPYDLSLADAGTAERVRWSNDVVAAIDRELGDVDGITFEIHAGSAYRDHGLVAGLRDRGATVEVPMANLPIGKQLAAYARQAGTREEPPFGVRSETASAVPALPHSPPGGAYAALSEHLAKRSDQAQVTMAFSDLEGVIGRALPASARKHRPWWANDATSHSQARAWLDVGWRVSKVDFNTARVTFEHHDRR